MAQNLAPNPDFEFYETCPASFSMGGPLEALPWTTGNPLSPDYYNACCSGCPVDVPFNLAGNQSAHSGNGYAGLYFRFPGKREYLMAPLLEPLAAGTVYHVEFYVSPAEFGCTTKPVGALFTIDPPVYVGEGILNYTPQIQVNGPYLDDYESWTLISGCFVAEGGENYITIGNYLDDDETPVNPECIIPVPYNTRSYYFVDDVVVEAVPSEELELELGDPVTVCDSHTIDPGIPDVDYFWDNGSNAPTLTVYQSGTYTLTISQGCSTGVDSIEVIIPNSFPVSLPDEEVTLCYPDEYQIEMDPEAGTYTWSNGTTGPSIVISQEGIYEVYLDNGCSITTDIVEVTVIHAPEIFTLGDELILCPDEEITFSFDPDVGNYLWQDGSQDPNYTIDYPGVYSLTITNPCGAVSDEVEVISSHFPQVELGDPVQYICDGVPIYFYLDPEEGFYYWQDGTDEPQYEITEVGQYSVTVSNDCGIAIDELTVFEISIPSIDLGPDQIICEDDSIVLNSDDDIGVYEWHDQSTATNYLVTTPGIHSLTVTNACGSDHDSVFIGFFPALGTVDLGDDIPLCPGDIVVLEPGIENASYAWQDLSMADTFLITSPGLYAVTISGQCYSVSDTVYAYAQSEPPNVDLIDVVELCEGNSFTIETGITGVNFLWSDASSADSLLISAPGVYSLTVSNSCGSDMDSVNVLNGGALPEISLGNDVNLCPGDEILLTPQSQNVDEWLWQNGAISETFLISEGGIIIVEVFNSCGSATDTLLTTVLQATPTFYLGADTSLCPGNEIIVMPDIQGIEVFWSDGSTNESLIISNPGTYYATLSGNCGTTSDTIVIGLLAPPPILNLGADLSLCQGQLHVINPGLSNVDYVWHDGSTNETFTVSQFGEIILSVSNDCGQDIDTLVVFENTEGPLLDLGPDILACEGDTVLLNAGLTGVDYLWQNNSTEPNMEVTVSGEYILQVSNGCGMDSDTVIVNISGNLPVPSLGSDTTLCVGTTLLLASDADPESEIIWQDGSGLPYFLVKSAGLYTLQESNHCGIQIDSIVVLYQSPPQEFDLGNDTVLCPGKSILLTIPPTTDEIMWQNGSGENIVEAFGGQEYSVVVSNKCGSASDEILVSENLLKPLINLEEIYFICPDEIIHLDGSQEFDVMYLWSTGSTQSSVSLHETGEYAVTVLSTCEHVVDEFLVLPQENCGVKEIFIPDIFSPNSDGMNDVFEVFPPPGLDIISIKGSIFDRWGNHLFESNGTHFSWDGKFNNLPMLPGVYVFKFEIDYFENGVEKHDIKIGDLNLLR